MNESRNPVRKMTKKARSKLSPWLIVAIVVLMFVGFAAFSGVKASASPPPPTSFRCPEAPVPFVLKENTVVEMNGQQVYIACAWVGGAVEGSPLPQQ